MKITKSERKALRGDNYAVKNSLKNGGDRKVGNTMYRGSNPEFIAVTDPSTGMVIRYQKVSPGIPWVRSHG